MSKQVFVRHHLLENVFCLQFHLSSKSNSCSYERFCKKTRFKTEVQGNSEMTYLIYFLSLSFSLFLTALECYACTSQPELSGGTKCESNKAEKITCHPLSSDSCITVKYTVAGPLGSTSVEQRNCSNSALCDPNSQFNGKCKNSSYLLSLRTGFREQRKPDSAKVKDSGGEAIGAAPSPGSCSRAHLRFSLVMFLMKASS